MQTDEWNFDLEKKITKQKLQTILAVINVDLIPILIS